MTVPFEELDADDHGPMLGARVWFTEEWSVLYVTQENRPARAMPRRAA